MNPAPGHVVITGASGFVGRVLTRKARAAGHEVIPLSRDDDLMPNGYEDVDALKHHLAGADVVLHLAARAHLGGTSTDFDCNVRATCAVARAALATGVRRLVLLSSIGVNGNVTRGRSFSESDAPAPVEPYARSKLRCEEEVRSILDGSSTQWTILRPPLVYGPDAPGNFGKLVRLVQSGVPLPLGAVRNRRSLIGVDNLSEAILLAGFHPAAAGQMFLLADGEDVSTPEIIRCIARGAKKRPLLLPVPPAMLKLAARLAGRRRIAESLCESLQVDASKARQVLGWIPSIGTQAGITAAAAATSHQ